LIPYFDLSDDQFEKVVVALGQRMFGAGLIGFTKGKDGGRDAKFNGTAALPPENWIVRRWSFPLSFPGWKRSGIA